MFALLHIDIASQSHDFMIYQEVIAIAVQKFIITWCSL